MDSDGQDLPQFESLSPSDRYVELTDYCVDQLLGWLDTLLDGDGIEHPEPALLGRLQRQRRSLRNGYRLQLHTLFSDFKAIRPLRRNAQPQPRWQEAALIDSRLHRIQPLIRSIEERILTPLEPRLRMLDRRMKYLVHRSDEGLEDNPLRPGNLSAALLAGLEGLETGHQRAADLIEYHAEVLEQGLPGFCRNLDLTLSELGVCFDLPFEENPQPEPVQSEADVQGAGDPAADRDSDSVIDGDAETGVREDASAASSSADAPDDLPSERLAPFQDTVEAEPEEYSETGDRAAETDSLDDEAEATDSTRIPEPEPAAECLATASAASVDDETEPTLTVAHTEPAHADTTEYSLDGDQLTTVPPEESPSTDLPAGAANDPQTTDSAEQDETGPEAGYTPHRAAQRIDSEMRQIIDALKQQCEAPEAVIDGFRDCVDRLCARVDAQRQDDLRKFAHFHTGLITNPHVSDPLRQLLLRLSAPLLYLVLSDPFFFRSSSHPVNDFLHSLIDFEIRHGHEPRNLKVLMLLIDNLLQLEVPVLSDFQPITQGYEVFKRLELERLNEEKKPLNGSRAACWNGSAN